MMAIAIQDNNESYELARQANEFVLAVPGPSLLKEAILFGTESLSDMDKFKEADSDLVASEQVDPPGLASAIANVELAKEGELVSGDHVVITGTVKRYAVRRDAHELPLLSIGPREEGYRLLEKVGMHRFATVDPG